MLGTSRGSSGSGTPVPMSKPATSRPDAETSLDEAGRPLEQHESVAAADAELEQRHSLDAERRREVGRLDDAPEVALLKQRILVEHVHHERVQHRVGLDRRVGPRPLLVVENL